MSIRSHLLRFAMLTCTFIGIAATANATTLTGTVKNPDGSNFNGVISFSLSSATTISSSGGCGGPIFVPNTYAPSVTVVNGVPNNSVNLYDSECMNPAGLAYNVQIISNTGLVLNQQWVITGTSENIGSIVPITQTGYVPQYVTQVICDSTMSCTPSTGIGAVTLHANGTGGGSGGAGFPSGVGIVYALTTTTSRDATSADVAGLLNTSPSTVLTASLLPDATSSAYGVVKCDGSTIQCSSGVISVIGGGGSSMTWPSTSGIMVYAGGSAYGTSLTAPSGTIVGTTDTQTLTNKTIDGITPTIMGYVDATSSIQTQLNAKQASIGYTPAHNGGNSDITSLTGLTTALPISEGGTGTTTPGLTAGSGITITGTWPNQTITFSGSSGGGTPGGTSGDLQFNCSGAFCGDGSTNDDGGGNITVTTLTTIGTTGEFFGNEGAAPTGVASQDALWSDSTNHRWMMNNNNGGAVQVVSSADLTNYLNLAGGTLTGNLNVPCIVYAGSTSGNTTICTSSVAGTHTITWPAATGAVQLTSAEVISYSSTPTFTATDSMSRLVLTGNITSFTLGSTASGVPHTLCFEQGSSSYTVSAPSNVHGFFTIGNTSGKWNCQSFMYDASDSIWLAVDQGITNE